MKLKILLSAFLLLIVLSYPVYAAQTWTNVSPSWDPANDYVYSMAVYGGNLYVGTYNGGPAGVWQYNGTTWTDVSPPWAAGNAGAESMAVYGGNLYAGTGNGGGAQVWQYNGTTWTNVSPSWTPDNFAVYSMAAYGSNLYVGTSNSGNAAAQVWQLYVGESTSVPTMTEWGMIIFMILAGLGSFCYLKRRKQLESQDSL